MKGFRHRCKRFFAVVIVRVDHGKGLGNAIRRAQHRVNGAVGLYAIGRRDKALGQGVALLKSIMDFGLFSDFIADQGAEFSAH